MESLFQIILTLGGAQRAQCLRVFRTRKKLFKDRNIRFFSQFFCKDSRLVVSSRPHFPCGARDRDQGLRGVQGSLLVEKTLQSAGHFQRVVVRVFPASLVFKPVQRTRNAPVPISRRPSAVEMLPAPAIGAVLLLRIHGFSAFAACTVSHRAGDIRALIADQGPVWLYGPVTDRASSGKEKVDPRCR